MAESAEQSRITCSALASRPNASWHSPIVGYLLAERLWRSVKYEQVYLRAYDSVGEARIWIGRHLEFNNRRRPHSSLDTRTPDHAYFNNLQQLAAA